MEPVLSQKTLAFNLSGRQPKSAEKRLMGARTYTSLPWGPAVCRVTLFHSHPVPRARAPRAGAAWLAPAPWGRRAPRCAGRALSPRRLSRGRAADRDLRGSWPARPPPLRVVVIGDFSVTRSSQQKVVISAALCGEGTTAAGAPWAGPGVGGRGEGRWGTAGAASRPPRSLHPAPRCYANQVTSPPRAR